MFGDQTGVEGHRMFNAWCFSFASAFIRKSPGAGRFGVDDLLRPLKFELPYRFQFSFLRGLILSSESFPYGASIGEHSDVLIETIVMTG